jgi:WhiB family transcriptional regulator, redox-sensing transcriptional regulator
MEVGTPMLSMLNERWNDLDWRIDAVCRDLNPEIFFPIGVTGQAIEQITVAKSHCATCPAKEQCLEFAVTTNQEYGVWGGTTEEERRALRRQWRAENRRASRRRSPAITAENTNHMTAKTTLAAAS